MSQSNDSAILSRPRYGNLNPVEASFHLFVADDSGGDCILSFAKSVSDDFFKNAEIIYVSTSDANAKTVESLQSLNCPRLYLGPSIEAALPRLSTSLARMRMGTQVYLSGSESLLGLATMTAMESGLDYQALQTEHKGSLARRMQCVHCKGITPDVITQPAECDHCGLLLLVRDHYSRRVAAFQGVNINAEDPSDVPEKGGGVCMSVNKIDVVVSDVVTVNSLIKRFHFKRKDESPLPAFSGGAHIIVEMQDGDTLRRTPYSLMSSPLDTSDYQISIRRDDEGRGGSLYMHNEVKVGMDMSIGFPTNLFSLDKRAPKQLMFAGGIGITPFLAQSHQLLATNGDFELHYSARNPELGAYGPELEQTIGRRLHMYYDDQDQRIDFDGLLSAQPAGTHVYVCGPAPMIEHVLARCEALGWPESHVHYEHFSKAPPGEPFTVELKASGINVDVGENQSLLEAMEAAGVDAPYLCRGGACGQCETDVLECNGTMLHEDHWLDDAELASNKKIMPCVSRFKGQRLVLDR